MTREHSNSVSRRKPDVGRRNSPASQTLDQARSALEAVDSNDSVKQLTERLNFLRQELEDMERQIMEEDQDFQMQKGHLVDKRDDKKAALKEKEDASKELRKEVATLERQSAESAAPKGGGKKEAQRRRHQVDS
jgi:regulator of replication initiation timing